GPSVAAKSLPTFVPGSRTRMPPLAFPTPSSSAAQIIPLDSTPRIFDLVILKSPGSTAPTRASGTFWPTAMFWTPQETESFCAPSSTTHRLSRSAFGCLAISKICAVTTPENAGPRRSMELTSKPSCGMRSASSAAESVSGRCSLSQLYEIFIELLEEADVVLVEEPDVFDAQAQHGDPFDPDAHG